MKSLVCLVVFICNLFIIYGFRFKSNFFGTNKLFRSSELSFNNRALMSTSESMSDSNRHFKSISKLKRSLTTTSLKFKVSSETELDKKVAERSLEIVQPNDEESVESTSPSLPIVQQLSKGVLPVSVAIGFFASKSPSLAVRLAGATLGGVSGFLLKKFIIDKYLEESFSNNNNNNNAGPPYSAATAKTISQLISAQKILNFRSKDVELIAKRNQVKEEELTALFTHLFAEMLYLITESNGRDLTQLVDIIDFAQNLELTPSEIGDGFAIAAIRIGRQLNRDERGFFTATYPENILLQASKLFFLGEKLLGAYEGFYGKRVETALFVQFPKETYNEVITSACKVLFKRCVESVLANPNSFNAEEVNVMKEFITTSADVSSFRPANMQNLILETIQYHIDSTLKQPDSHENIKLTNYDNLINAQKILGWNSRELTDTIELKTVPIFESYAKEVIYDLFQYPDHGMNYNDDCFDERMNSLYIRPIRARSVITTILSEKNNEYAETINKVYETISKSPSSSSSVTLEPIYKLMINYARTYDELKRLTKSMMNDTALPLPGLPLADMIRANLYNYKLTSQKNNKLSDLLTDEMFSLNPKQIELVKRSISLPKIISWIRNCIKSNTFDNNAKAAYEKYLKDYNVTSEEWMRTAIDFYYQEANKISKSKAIPSMDDIDRLKLLSQFLNLNDKNGTKLISKVHLELFHEKYIKALNECMTPTGVIVSEYVDSLERLRIRLGLTINDAKYLLAYTIRNKMTVTIKSLYEQYESNTDPKKIIEKKQKLLEKKSTDMISSIDNQFGFVNVDDKDENTLSSIIYDSSQKRDGGMNVFMSEVLNLIDFYEMNYNVLGFNPSNSSILSVEPSMIVDPLDDEGSNGILVTGTGILPEKNLTDIFKHYVLTRLAEKDVELKKRYLNNENKFGYSLGLDQENIKKIRITIAYTIYKRLFMNILETRETGLSSSDTQQFVLLKENLLLTNEESDRIYQQAMLSAVFDYCSEKLLNENDEDSKVTPQMVTRFRVQIQSFGLDIRKDIGFNERLLAYLYAIEVQQLIETGQEDDLSEILEFYSIPEDKAQLIIESTCKRYLDQLFNLALRATKRYDETDAIKYLREIMKYSPFVSSSVNCDGSLFTKKEVDRLVDYWIKTLSKEYIQNIEDDDEKNKKIEDGAETIKRLIDLRTDYQPPQLGIQGLLGGTPTFSDVMKADLSENKKTWAWG